MTLRSKFVAIAFGLNRVKKCFATFPRAIWQVRRELIGFSPQSSNPKPNMKQIVNISLLEVSYLDCSVAQKCIPPRMRCEESVLDDAFTCHPVM
jgi:hypothetical protein